MSLIGRKKIKVAHIITRLIIGGAQENTLLSVCGLQHTYAYDVTLLSGPTYGPEGSLEEKARHATNLVIIPALVRNINPFKDLLALRQLYHYLKAESFAIVHTHSSKAGILGRLAAKIAGVPVIVHTIHGLPFFKGQHSLRNRLYFFLEKHAARCTHKIIGVSQSIIDDAVAAGLAPREKFARIYSGVDIAAFRKNSLAAEAIRKKLGIPPASPVIGKIARLFYLKGHEYLLEAAVHIKKAMPQARILLVGDGILKKKLLRLAEKLGVADIVVFAGLIQPEAIPVYLQTMNILAHVSLHEGLPRAVVQGFAGGIPAVCFNIDGARDIIHHGINGYLVDPKNTLELANRLIELLKDPEKAASMGNAGQRLVRDQFGTDTMVASIDFVYRELRVCGK